MNFDLTEEQQLLIQAVSAFAKKESPLTRLREMRKDPIGWSKDLWRRMGEYGWIGVSLPESAGGLGGSFADVALILEHLAPSLVPEPLLPSLVAASPILRLGTDAQKEQLLGPMIQGETSLALAWAEAQGRFDVADVETKAHKTQGGYSLTGRKVFVQNGHAADHLVISARTSGGPRDREGVSLFVVPREHAGVTVQSIKTMDGHHAAMITLASAEVGEGARLGPEGGAFEALDEAMDVGAAGACAEGYGIMKAALAMTADYLRTREQFGVKIGSFQALQHRTVDMMIEVELCKSTAILAAIKVSDPSADERRSAVSAAKAQLASGGRFVTQQAIQLHGGIGVTDEHDIGLYFKRMVALNTLYGDGDHHLERFAHSPSFDRAIVEQRA